MQLRGVGHEFCHDAAHVAAVVSARDGADLNIRARGRWWGELSGLACQHRSRTTAPPASATHALITHTHARTHAHTHTHTHSPASPDTHSPASPDPIESTPAQPACSCAAPPVPCASGARCAWTAAPCSSCGCRRRWTGRGSDRIAAQSRAEHNSCEGRAFRYYSWKWPHCCTEQSRAQLQA